MSLVAMSALDFAMDNPQQYARIAYTCCKDKFGYLSNTSCKLDLRKSNDLVVFLQGDSITFSNYLCSETETQLCNDLEYSTKIPRPLLLRMLLHVHSTGFEGKVLSAQLLRKINDNKIDLSQDPVLITPRDLCQRLLSRIPWNGTFYTHAADTACLTLRIQDALTHIEVRKCVHNPQEVKVYTGPHTIRIPGVMFDEERLRAEIDALVKSGAS